MNTSPPRTDSPKRARISPFGKVRQLARPDRHTQVGGDVLGQRRVRTPGVELKPVPRDQFHLLPPVQAVGAIAGRTTEPGATTVPGANQIHGPTCASSPIVTCSAKVALTCALAPTTQSTK